MELVGSEPSLRNGQYSDDKVREKAEASEAAEYVELGKER